MDSCGKCRIIRPATHAGWLEERAKGIGSSDAGTVMGLNPWCTPYRLWRQKTGRDPGTEENEAMRNGHILEPAVAAWFADRTGCLIDPGSEGDWIAAHNVKDYLRVSPDRLYWPQGTAVKDMTWDNARILEIKTTAKAVDPDDIPLYWYCQVQYQMAVTGIRKASLCWLTGSPVLGFGHCGVDFNPAYASGLVKAVEDFWLNNVKADVEPPLSDGGDALLLFPKDCGGETEATREEYEECLSLLEAKRTIAALDDTVKAAAERLKARMGGSAALAYTDPATGERTTLATWKSTVRNGFDEERFRSEMPDKASEYEGEERPIDLRRLKADEPELYAAYAVKSAGPRKFMLKDFTKRAKA